MTALAQIKHDGRLIVERPKPEPRLYDGQRHPLHALLLAQQRTINRLVHTVNRLVDKVNAPGATERSEETPIKKLRKTPQANPAKIAAILAQTDQRYNMVIRDAQTVFTKIEEFAKEHKDIPSLVQYLGDADLLGLRSNNFAFLVRMALNKLPEKYDLDDPGALEFFQVLHALILGEHFNDEYVKAFLVSKNLTNRIETALSQYIRTNHDFVSNEFAQFVTGSPGAFSVLLYLTPALVQKELKILWERDDFQEKLLKQRQKALTLADDPQYKGPKFADVDKVYKAKTTRAIWFDIVQSLLGLQEHAKKHLEQKNTRYPFNEHPEAVKFVRAITAFSTAESGQGKFSAPELNSRFMAADSQPRSFEAYTDPEATLDSLEDVFPNITAFADTYIQDLVERVYIPLRKGQDPNDERLLVEVGTVAPSGKLDVEGHKQFNDYMKDAIPIIYTLISHKRLPPGSLSRLTNEHFDEEGRFATKNKKLDELMKVINEDSRENPISKHGREILQYLPDLATKATFECVQLDDEGMMKGLDSTAIINLRSVVSLLEKQESK